MIFHAVIDTNVLVSAMLKGNSVPGAVLSFVFDGTIIPVFNNSILDEYRKVLERPKFKFPADIIDTVINHLQNTGIMLNADKLDIQLPDSGDLVFYEVTMEKRKTGEAYLVTGNRKHFPAETFIVTLREMLDVIIRKLT